MQESSERASGQGKKRIRRVVAAEATATAAAEAKHEEDDGRKGERKN